MSLYGELAQLGEHLPCTQGVKGSSPLFSTISEAEKSVKLKEEPRKLNKIYLKNTEKR